MKLLDTIFRVPGIPIGGKTIHRSAVRAIVVRENELLLIHSAKNGDYKFPGGGVEKKESHPAALARELNEECGAQLARFGPAFGKIIEYDKPVEQDFSVFRMVSHYYWCQIETLLHSQVLDKYEAELGFQPVWVKPEQAIEINQQIMKANMAMGDNRAAIPWLQREIFVLLILQKIIYQQNSF
jgi:8-oxo-dGTP pyrophosphatase MutT (NUDIX family)